MLINKSNTVFYLCEISYSFQSDFLSLFFSQESVLSKGNTFNLHLIDDKSENLVAGLQKEVKFSYFFEELRIK